MESNLLGNDIYVNVQIEWWYYEKEDFDKQVGELQSMRQVVYMYSLYFVFWMYTTHAYCFVSHNSFKFDFNFFQTETLSVCYLLSKFLIVSRMSNCKLYIHLWNMQTLGRGTLEWIWMVSKEYKFIV